MGLTHITLRVANPADSERGEDLVCLVDSGAWHTVVPGDVLARLGIAPHSTRRFTLADGSIITRKLASAVLEYEGLRGDSPVIVGEPDDYPLVGVLTLEAFGIMLDPLKRELRPMTLRMPTIISPPSP